MSIELSNADQFISWINTKSRLNAIADRAAMRCVKRGEVYWCHFGLNIGSEMSKTTPRPAVIISNNNINKKSSNVVVAPITHSKSQSPYLITITPFIDSNGRVILDGKVDTADTICISKARLCDLITTLPISKMRDIDQGIAISLDLYRHYADKVDSYSRLTQYVERVKSDRNIAQNTIKEIKCILSQDSSSDQKYIKLKELLDI